MSTIAKLLAAASYSAKQHTHQKRKGERGEPYINHPLEVANLLATVGGIEDIDVIIAGLLHDTIEDTETTDDDLKERFGERVAELVKEVTDDKGLSKGERKRRQVEHAPHLSPDAKAIKLADKISNIHDVTFYPPSDWTLERRVQYVDWGVDVVRGLRGTNAALEAEFDRLITVARKKMAQVGEESPSTHTSPSA